MDPKVRLRLERLYEAIVDAGVEPETVRGRKVAVFVGSGVGDFNEALGSDPEEIDGLSLLGTTRSMFFNRLSYTFDFRGTCQ